jgi:hypothetical protein
MHVCVQVSATILYHHQAIIGVRGLKQRRQNDPAGGNPQQDEGVDFPRAEDHVKVSAGEGTDPVLGNSDLVSLRRYGGVDFARRAFEKTLVSCGVFDGTEQGVAWADLWKIRAETNADVDYRHS